MNELGLLESSEVLCLLCIKHTTHAICCLAFLAVLFLIHTTKLQGGDYYSYDAAYIERCVL